MIFEEDFFSLMEILERLEDDEFIISIPVKKTEEEGGKYDEETGSGCNQNG